MRQPTYRMTSQRRLLLDLVRQQAGHFDADELFRRARERRPRISLSTVYRVLQLFRELGLVEEYHFGENHLHYEAKPPTEHHHMICLGCGEISEFQSRLVSRLRKEVADREGFEVSSVDIRLGGYCARCREKGIEGETGVAKDTE